MMFTKKIIQSMHNSGEKLDYILFWKPTGEDQKKYMCQWYISPFKVDGVWYRSTEHWMMIQKAQLFDDQIAVDKMMVTIEPQDVKRLGRSVNNFDQNKWDCHKSSIVYMGNKAKFSQNEDLKNYLIGTGSKILVEASPYDAIWGIGMGEEDEDATNPNKWKGQNLLGFALMKVREELVNNV